MRTIAKLFGRSPFGPLQVHMQRVVECVTKAVEAIDAFKRGESDRVDEFAKEISKLEHQADVVKIDIRNHLPRSMFLPVDRNNLLDILTTQDAIADAAEDIGWLLTFKAMPVPEWMAFELDAYVAKNVEAFEAASQIVDELDELLEYAFGGAEAEKVKKMVDDVAFREHEADLLQHALIRTMFQHDSEFDHSSFYQWQQIVQKISQFSNLSERLANRLRLILERK